MECAQIQEALSAMLDGEDPELTEADIDAHLMECADCRAWQSAAAALAEAVSVRARGRGPDDAVARNVLALTRPRRQWRTSLSDWRFLLALVAVADVLVAWPGIFLSEGHASAHLSHELTSWDMGLALGFLFLAWKPSRAWGSLPLVATIVACLVGTSALDLISGQTLLGREIVHLFELAGLGCTWAVARRDSSSSVVLRLA
jgi:predicted anti-sigma-YlaC factor YlaD